MEFHLISNLILVIYLIIISSIYSYLMYEESDNRVPIIIIYHLCNIGGIFLHWYSNKRKYQQLYEENAEKIKEKYVIKIHNMQQSINYILHEIKNLLNPLYIVLQNNPSQRQKMSATSINKMQDTIENCIKLCGNMLGFESLLRLDYVPKPKYYQLSDCVSDLVNLSRNYYQAITISSNITPETKILIDVNKYNQVVRNGLNAIREYGNNNEINIRINYLIKDGRDYLLTEIINPIDNIDPSEINDKVFLPFFLRRNSDIWKDYRKIFDLDSSFNSIIQRFLGNKILKYIIVINEKFSNTIHQNPQKSLGLNLPIARLISKNLGGECDFYFQDIKKNKKIIRFWSLIKINTNFGNFQERCDSLEEIPL